MNVLIIARLTLHEAVRRRLILAGVVLSLLYLALFGVGFAQIFERVGVGDVPPGRAQQSRALFSSLMTMMGMYSVSFMSGFVAMFLSVGAVSADADSGALHAILARPLHRFQFIFGRWLAYCGLA